MSVVINKNGRTIVVNGDFIRRQTIGTMVINEGKITVDGKPLTELDKREDEKVINITIEGNVDRLEIDSCTKVEVQGDARRIKTSMGDIEIHGDVEGDVHTNIGSITCGYVSGDCHTNMGSISHR